MFEYIKSSVRTFKTSKHIFLLIAFSVGICLRLFLAYNFFGNYDQESYEIVAKIVASGGNVYAETSRYNYSPIWSLILLFLYKASLFTKLPFHFIIRTFLTFIDCLVAILIGLITQHSTKRSGVLAAVVYILNPVSILIIGYHGQFENLATLMLLLAVYVYLAEPGRRFVVLFFSALSLLIKHITIFSIWTLMNFLENSRSRAIVLNCLLILIFIMSFLPYWPEGKDGIFTNVFLYPSIPGLYGLSTWIKPVYILPWFLGIMITLPLFLREQLKLSIVKAMQIMVLVFLAITPGIGEQYFILPIIWGSITRSRWYWVYTITVFLFLLGSDNNLNLPVPTIWNSVWIVVIGWLINLLLLEKDTTSLGA